MTTTPGDGPIEITTAQVQSIADAGVWDRAGGIRPEAAAVGEALVAALKAHSGAGLSSVGELDGLVTQALNVAVPGFPQIEGEGGVNLSAHTWKQLGPGPHPVIIVPAGWNPVGWVLFEYAYIVLALKGYHVLAYTPRGIGATLKLPGGGYLDSPFTSGGTIDIGGPKDWADASKVIDYAVEHFAPSKIGFLGESYGSGISQLVAAHDDRVAVVAALSTWGNLATSLYDNQTRHTRAVAALLDLTGGPVERKFDGENLRMLRDFQANRNLDEVQAWGTVRAPETYVSETNRRQVPTFISNTWHEGLFPPNQVIETFNLLTGPKRLNMWIGDHTAPEAPALVAPPAPGAGPNLAMAEAYAWLDYHLLGVQNGVNTWPQVNNQVMFTYATTPVLDPETGAPTGENQITRPAVREPKATWNDVTTDMLRLGLTGQRSGSPDGELAENDGEATETGWERIFTAGAETEATAMDGIVVTGQAEWAGNPKIYETGKIDRDRALVWTARPQARRIRGSARVHLTVRSTVAYATLVAYLFGVDEEDRATIITHEPLTLPDLAPDTDVTVEWRLQAAAYDLPANHRLMLVIGSRDRLYGDENTNQALSQTTISSPEGDPSYLDLPLG